MSDELLYDLFYGPGKRLQRAIKRLQQAVDSDGKKGRDRRNAQSDEWVLSLVDRKGGDDTCT